MNAIKENQTFIAALGNTDVWKLSPYKTVVAHTSTSSKIFAKQSFAATSALSPCLIYY